MSPVWYPASFGQSEAIDLNLRLQGKPSPGRDYNLKARLLGSTWSRMAGNQAVLTYDMARMDKIGYAWWAPFAKDMDWIEAAVRLEETESRKETVTVHDASLAEMPPDRGHTGSWLKVMLPASQRQGVTPDGVQYSIDMDHTYLMGDSSEVSVLFLVNVTPKDDRVFLKRSPLCRVTGKPVELSVLAREPRSGAVGYSDSFIQGGARQFNVSITFRRLRPADGLRLPPIDLEFCQKAYLGEPTFRVVAPLRPGKTPWAFPHQWPPNTTYTYTLDAIAAKDRR